MDSAPSQTSFAGTGAPGPPASFTFSQHASTSSRRCVLAILFRSRTGSPICSQARSAPLAGEHVPTARPQQPPVCQVFRGGEKRRPVRRNPFVIRVLQIGGEGGIRTPQEPLDSVSYRFYIPRITVDASDAVAPCTLLHAQMSCAGCRSSPALSGRLGGRSPGRTRRRQHIAGGHSWILWWEGAAYSAHPSRGICDILWYMARIPGGA
jgi:hypothetical protein